MPTVQPNCRRRFLKVVGVAWEDESQETTSESTPDQRCSNTYPGPRRPIGDDRLMDSVQAPSDPPPVALCPTCGSTSSAEVIRKDGAALIGDYRCAAGHIWITKWMVSA